MSDAEQEIREALKDKMTPVHEFDDALYAMLDELDRLRADAERIDCLESMINEYGEIHLHDGQHPRGIGLGLRSGYVERTLREAIDEARGKK